MGGTPARRFESLRRKFPALNVAEALIWREWLKLHESQWDALPDAWIAYRRGQPGEAPSPGDVFDYNVRLGPGRDPGPDTPPNLRAMAILISQLRLDAVGFRADSPTIFEVKRQVGPEQIGQLITYRSAWRAFAVPFPIPQLYLVGQSVTANVLPVVSELGITLDQVTVDLSVLSPKSVVTG